VSSNRIIGIVFLVIGVGLFVFGMNASNSAADQISHTFTGRFTDGTTWYILGGLAAAVVGVVMMLPGGKGHSA